ncbi:MAG TPA: TonB family protein [Chthoniobacterales bacterium]|nr:TonB family protein [Chthoniobacterales bacterium]
MNAHPITAFAVLAVLQLAFLSPCRATDVVTIDAKYKKDSISAPDPEFPITAQHLGEQGQGIYRLLINEKTGVVDEVKVLKSTRSRKLDASAVMTFFKWTFRPGSTKQRDVAVNFHLTGWSRGLH